MLAQKRYKKTGGILANARITKLEKEGYCVLDLDEEDCEELKNKAPGLYDKIYQQGKKEGYAQGKESAERHYRIMAKSNKERKQAEEKDPKTLEEKLKAAWDSKPELRKEFGGSYASCKNYFENEFNTTGKMSF